MPHSPYHRPMTRPSQAVDSPTYASLQDDNNAAAPVAKPHNTTVWRFAKLKKLMKRKPAILLLLMLPFSARAEDNSAAYAAMNHMKMPGHVKESKNDEKMHKVAKQFESTFMTEMIHLARPKDKAAKGFSTGESGNTYDVFMDQALGEAAASGRGMGLTKQIEDAMGGKRGAHHAAQSGQQKIPKIASTAEQVGQQMALRSKP